MGRLLLLGLGLTLVASCNNDPVQPQHVPCNQFLLDYEPVGTDTVTVDDGVKYVDVSTGAGPQASRGQIVQVNYTLYVPDGELFESSCPPNRGVLPVHLGGGGTIPAFQTGIVGMSMGGVRRVFIPHEVAYTSGPLAGADLTFDIELVRIFGS